MPAKRCYKKEYENYQGTPEQKKARAKRNKARAQAVKSGKAKSGEDVDHKKPLRSGGSNKPSNTRSRSKSANRADNGHKKGEKQKKWK